MTCSEARKFLWQKPFTPVCIRLKDGRTFKIPHPHLTLAAEAVLIIGIPPPEEPESIYPDRSLWVQWPQVDQIETLPTAAAPTI